VIGLGDNFYSNAEDNGSNRYAGVKSVKDKRFKEIWENTFLKGTLNKTPWYHVLGFVLWYLMHRNHDWMGNARAQVEYSKTNKLWNLPSFMYDFKIKLGSFGRASFYFIDTSLFEYGYSGENFSMRSNFVR
jgi:tartrate-resistant acid phosphatase type 5